MSDLISRQAAIDADTLKKTLRDWIRDHWTEAFTGDDAGAEFADMIEHAETIDAVPSAQPEVRPIDYQDCSNAMLKMWMDNVVTDREYNRIMDKLNAHWGKKDG